MIGYRIETTPDDNGTVLITCPALPEVTTFADPSLADQTFLAARAAIGEAIAARIASGSPVPSGAPDPRSGDRRWVVYLDPLVSLKVELFLALQRSGVSRAELSRRLNWNRNSVDRLFKLDHASKVDQIVAAAGALGLEVETLLASA